MSIPSRMQDRVLVLSKLKQANYATILTDANLQAGKRISPKSAFFGQPMVTRWSDMNLSMKDHPYSTQVQEIQHDLNETQVLTGTSSLLARAFAFSIGTVTSSQ